MLSFNQHLTEQMLAEKLIMINQGKKYGQVVFLAGGAGSGKGFSQNFFNSTDFKIRDVDEMKRLFLKVEKEKGKYPEIKGLNLRNPNDVAKLHMWVEKGGFDDNSLNNTLRSMGGKKEILPNIVFDVTLKNIKKYHTIMEQLIPLGYEPKNVHLIWVLANYSVAVAANRERERVVPEDILLKTHEGAHKTMWEIVGKGNIPPNLDGGIYVILADRNATIARTDSDGKVFKGGKYGKDAGKKIVIKDFKYLTYKEPGKAPKTDNDIKLELTAWVAYRVPMTAKVGVFESVKVGKTLKLTDKEADLIGNLGIIKQEYQLDKTQRNYRASRSDFSMPFTGEEDLDKLKKLIRKIS